MPLLKLRNESFTIRAPLMDRCLFEKWLKGPGKYAYAQERRHTRFGWFFGGRRAKRSLFVEIRRLLKPGSIFCDDLERELNGIGVYIRKVAITIKSRGYRDLFTVEGPRLLVVVPRGIVRNDFMAHIDKTLGDSPQLRRFSGLARTVLGRVSLEAEAVFFESVLHGKKPVDKTGRGYLAGADRDYPWRFGNVMGHYLYATAAGNEIDLYDKRQFKRFKDETDEIRKGQEEYIKRLRSHERVALAAAFGAVDDSDRTG